MCEQDPNLRSKWSFNAKPLGFTAGATRIESIFADETEPRLKLGDPVKNVQWER